LPHPILYRSLSGPSPNTVHFTILMAVAKSTRMIG
jgi:hypothetical protein